LLRPFGGGGVVGAHAGLVDGQGAPVQGVGVVEVALVVQDVGEVAEAAGGGEGDRCQGALR
jgi:hypothetical protein